MWEIWQEKNRVIVGSKEREGTIKVGKDNDRVRVTDYSYDDKISKDELEEVFMKDVICGRNDIVMVVYEYKTKYVILYEGKKEALEKQARENVQETREHSELVFYEDGRRREWKSLFPHNE